MSFSHQVAKIKRVLAYQKIIKPEVIRCTASPRFWHPDEAMDGEIRDEQIKAVMEDTELEFRPSSEKCDGHNCPIHLEANLTNKIDSCDK